jgi:hypothetical protein
MIPVEERGWLIEERRMRLGQSRVMTIQGSVQRLIEE